MKTILAALLTFSSLSALATPSHSIKCRNSVLDASERNVSIEIQSNCGPCDTGTEFLIRLSFSKFDQEGRTYKVSNLQKVLDSFQIEESKKTDYFKKEVVTWLDSSGSPSSTESTIYRQISYFDAVIKDKKIPQSPISLFCTYKSSGTSVAEIKNYGLKEFLKD